MSGSCTSSLPRRWFFLPFCYRDLFIYCCSPRKCLGSEYPLKFRMILHRLWPCVWVLVQMVFLVFELCVHRSQFSSFRYRGTTWVCVFRVFAGITRITGRIRLVTTTGKISYDVKSFCKDIELLTICALPRCMFRLLLSVVFQCFNNMTQGYIKLPLICRCCCCHARLAVWEVKATWCW